MIHRLYTNLIVALSCVATTAAFSVQPLALNNAAVGSSSSFALGSTPVSKSSWDITRVSPMTRIEGQTRKTFDFPDQTRDVVQVMLKSEGRPMSAEIQLWIGPDWTPFKLNIYSEDGRQFPVQILVGTRNKLAQIEVRNTGPYEYPLNAACTYAEPPVSNIRKTLPETSQARYVEGGGAIYSIPFGTDADQIQCLLNTDSRQLNCRVELLNGPNNYKQTYEVFTNNGLLNALYIVFNTTPGTANTVRIKNIANVEFPCNAFVSKL